MTSNEKELKIDKIAEEGENFEKIISIFPLNHIILMPFTMLIY